MSQEIYGNPQHWKVKSTTNLLILMLFAAILVNSLVILGVQLWFVYDLDSPEAALSDYREDTVLDSVSRNALQSWLLEEPDGTMQLLTVERHVIAEKYRIVESGTLEIGAEPFTKTIWGDTALAHLTVSNRSFESYNETPMSLQIIRNGPRIPMVFLLYSLLLIAIEIGVGIVIHKIRGT